MPNTLYVRSLSSSPPPPPPPSPSRKSRVSLYAIPPRLEMEILLKNNFSSQVGRQRVYLALFEINEW